MTRRMGDAVNPLNLVPGMDLYAGYDDGRYGNIAAIQSRFPGKTVLRYTVLPGDNEGDALDVERGDATPADAPGWTTRRRAAGHGGPLNYISWDSLPDLLAAYKAAAVALPGIIVAGYPGPDGDAIPVVAGVNIVGHQWIDHNGLWDESIMVDYLPGIDPAPIPVAPVTLPTLGWITGSVQPYWVKSAQALLIEKFNQAIALTGIYDAATTAAVRSVQAFFGMTIDGVVGAETWAVLLGF